ncbi:MAG TPA: cation-translocating P-type ATPase [Clostridiales bacterium]|nr:cation-translocating P-type ATPase [Clostridiales bacterium]
MKNSTPTVRIPTVAEIGLTDEQVNSRYEQGLYNKESSLKTKSVGRIFRDNIVTLFNIINFILAIAVLLVGSYKNMLFMGVIFFNIAIGTFQEIRAKKTIDKMSIISQSKIKVIRNSLEQEININEVVLDDIIVLSQGNQVPTDCVLVSGTCEANESLLTGESDAIFKIKDDKLMSGSFIVSGKCYVRAESVGEDNYAASLSNKAKYLKKVNSEIMNTLNKIIKIISIVIIPLGILLFWRQMTLNGFSDINDAVVSTVAALIGMIPEGLILLTSTVLAVGVIRLSRQKVLVQELYCIETLARVDVLCLDKTGTITEGCMEVHDIVPIGGTSADDLKVALIALANASQDSNPTINAIKDKYNEKSELEPTKVVAFSSEKKWSGASFGNNGTYVMGAEEFVLGDNVSVVKDNLASMEEGFRVILIAHSPEEFNDRCLPNNLSPIGIVIIKDKIREEAKATLDYFSKQGVDLKVISGDNVKTVSAVAKLAGLEKYDKCVDATTLKSYDDIKVAVEKYSVFGRVTPSQKYDMVKALKEKNHTVAMTGDGVNDVLALKEADCSVAMASGSDAARSVSQLVLLDSNFASMPRVVAEGRRSINNIQRSSTLFLIKTIYSCLLAVIFVFLGAQYPFEPIQMTLISTFTIGIPSFILALEPNSDRVQGQFFTNVMSKSAPGGITVTLAMVFIVIMQGFFHFDAATASTYSVTVTAFIGLLVLFKISIPFNIIRGALFIAMTTGCVVGITAFQWFFNLVPYSISNFIHLLFPLCFALVVYVLLSMAFEKIKLKKYLQLPNINF